MHYRTTCYRGGIARYYNALCVLLPKRAPCVFTQPQPAWAAYSTIDEQAPSKPFCRLCNKAAGSVAICSRYILRYGKKQGLGQAPPDNPSLQVDVTQDQTAAKAETHRPVGLWDRIVSAGGEGVPW